MTLHFTPTYSWWLNQVELWFSKVQPDVLSRGIFTSTADLARKLRRYIDAYSKRAKPFRWKYANPTRRITHGKPNSKTVHKLMAAVTREQQQGHRGPRRGVERGDVEEQAGGGSESNSGASRPTGTGRRRSRRRRRG